MSISQLVLVSRETRTVLTAYVNYNNYKNFIKTNEDINNDTKYTNKHKDTKHDARDLHE